MASKGNFWVRKGKIEDLDRSFDHKFWQSQTLTDRFAAAWDLVLNYHVGVLSQDENQLRLQRSFIKLQQRKS